MKAVRRRLVPLLSLALLVASAACGSAGEPGTPAASEPAPVTQPKRTTTTEAMTPEEEVEAAYLRSWEVYADAMLNLDASLLGTAFADDALELRRSEVDMLAKAGTPALMRVDHGIHAISIDGDAATLLDRYVNHSVLVDAESGDPIEPDPNEEVRRAYTLRKTGGTWKVVFVQDDSSSPA